jgi:hypothetical protein
MPLLRMLGSAFLVRLMNIQAWIKTQTTAKPHRTSPTGTGLVFSVAEHTPDASADVEPLAHGMGWVAPKGQKKFWGHGVQLDCE